MNKLFMHILHHRGIHVDSQNYTSLLRECTRIKALGKGKESHAHMIKIGFEPDIFQWNHLLNMYSKCGSIIDARLVFDKMPQRNIVSWTAMITGYAQHGNAEEALKLCCYMQRAEMKLNEFTFASVIGVCATLAFMKQGKQVHAHAIKSGFVSNVFVGCALVDMYAKYGNIENVRHVFEKMPERNLVSWNAVISGYAQNGCGQEALNLFCQMQLAGVKPDPITFTSSLMACVVVGGLNQGKQIHVQLIKSGFVLDVFVGSTLIDMYGKCGDLQNARKVFDEITERDVVSWNSMIARYAQNGCTVEAMSLFHQMPNPDAVSWNAIIAGFSQHGHDEEALDLFCQMPKKDVVAWNTIISGYAQNGYGEKALKYFCEMQEAGVKQDQFTFASVLSACAILVILEQGKVIHGHIIKRGFQSEMFVGSALVDMYAKCGSIECAQRGFDRMPQRNVITWNAMIAGYALNGYGKEALECFEEMQLTGLKPDHITFVAVLRACSHSGLVADGLRYFSSMSHDHGITPSVKHCSCVVDLLGRAGRLDEAENFIMEMSFESGAVLWRALLGACRVHGSVELGKRAAERVFELEPHDDATYVLLSNLYAAAGRWDDADAVRKTMKDSGVKKQPGCSWIEVKNTVNTFFAGDRSHPQTKDIYAKLESLFGQMKDSGYMVDTNFVLHDVEVEQKEHSLCHHSEKLAIAFGLISTPQGATLEVSYDQARNLLAYGCPFGPQLQEGQGVDFVAHRSRHRFKARERCMRGGEKGDCSRLHVYGGGLAENQAEKNHNLLLLKHGNLMLFGMSDQGMADAAVAGWGSLKQDVHKSVDEDAWHMPSQVVAGNDDKEVRERSVRAKKMIADLQWLQYELKDKSNACKVVSMVLHLPTSTMIMNPDIGYSRTLGRRFKIWIKEVLEEETQEEKFFGDEDGKTLFDEGQSTLYEVKQEACKMNEMKQREGVYDHAVL
eukprot:Gb_28676 [translate_table: standard]